MFGWLQKKPRSKGTPIRDAIFGEIPLSDYPTADATAADREPWSTFVEARIALHQGNQAGAIALLQAVTTMAGLESRHYVQAWYFLRKLGVSPPEDQAHKLYGIVVEIGLETGPELVAAYADLSARYLNYTGSMVVWEGSDDKIRETIQALLEIGRLIVAQTGPGDWDHPPAPLEGDARIVLLTPGGMHYGEGSEDQLSADQMGGPMLSGASHLLNQLVDKAMERLED